MVVSSAPLFGVYYEPLFNERCFRCQFLPSFFEYCWCDVLYVLFFHHHPEIKVVVVEHPEGKGRVTEVSICGVIDIIVCVLKDVSMVFIYWLVFLVNEPLCNVLV